MRTIKPPLDRNSQGSEVFSLQDGLLLLSRQQALRIPENEQQTVEAGLQREQIAQIYGDFTQRTVSLFQRSSGFCGLSKEGNLVVKAREIAPFIIQKSVTSYLKENPHFNKYDAYPA